MIRNNIILLYIIYIIALIILCIIDASILLYYIFWILNVFIHPFIWLMLKVIFFNRYILLLLLFYYLLAKYTIEIPGYKYFEFFGMDVKKLREDYLNNLFSITTYHIEMLSIFIFFIIIIMPFLYNNEVVFVLACLFFIFSILLLKIYKYRLHFFRNKSQTFLNLFVGWFFIFIIFKIMNYHHYKDVFTIYMHFDEWVFNFIELKICMYKDPPPPIKGPFSFYFKPKAKPIWLVEKINVKDKWYEREWDHLNLKKKFNIFKEWEDKLLIKKQKYINYKKNYKLLFNLSHIEKKLLNASKFLEYIKKKVFIKKYLKFYNKKVNYKKDVRFWNFERLSDSATFDKELEYYAHKAIISKSYFYYSILNYYKFNSLLENLSIKKSVYNESFFDQKKSEENKLRLKKNRFYFFVEKRFIQQKTLDLLYDVLNKIKKNKQYMKRYKKEEKVDDSFLIKKIYKYSMAKKIKEKRFKAFSITEVLNKLNDRINFKRNWYNIDFVKKYKRQILKNEENILIKTSPLLIFPKYIKRDDLEKLDNKLLISTLEKYQKESTKTKSKYRKEESSLILKKNQKTDLIVNPGPDLSRRDNK